MRIFKNLWISIGSAVRHRDGYARLDGLAVDNHFFGGCAGKAAIWTEESDKLFHGGWYEAGILSELLLDVLVFGEVVADSTEH